MDYVLRSLHVYEDHYENIYVVLRGAKVFTLLPPAAAYRMHTHTYPAAKYHRDHEGQLKLRLSTPRTDVPWSPIELPRGKSDVSKQSKSTGITE